MRKTVMAMLAAAGLAWPGCGSSKDDDSGKEATGAAEQAGDQSGAAGGGDETAGAEKELEPPPEDAYQGKSRLINLYVDGDGNAQAVDVWAKKSFEHDAVKLAENVQLGASTEWLGVPDGQRAVVVPTGAEPNAENLAGLNRANEGERYTNVLVWEDGEGSAGGWKTHPVADDSAFAPPAEKKGLVLLHAGQLGAHVDALREEYGGRAFHVGDGEGNCRPRRGQKPDSNMTVMLGGTNQIDLELDPGEQTITLHERGEDCSAEPVYSFDVEVKAGEGTRVEIYTPDAEKLAHASFPMAFGEVSE